MEKKSPGMKPVWSAFTELLAKYQLDDIDALSKISEADLAKIFADNAKKLAKSSIRLAKNMTE